jgi:hypothetical protein
MGDWAYRVQLAYGTDFMNRDWQSYGIKTTNLVDLKGGGGLSKMRLALAAAAIKPAR